MLAPTDALADPNDFGQALAKGKDGRIYLGGRIVGLATPNGSVAAHNIARWEPRREVWEALPGGGLVAGGPGAGFVSTLASDPTGRFIYAGGSFSRVIDSSGGLTPITTNFARYDTQTNQWQSLGSVSGTIRQIRLVGSESAIIVGQFTNASGVQSRNVVFWDGLNFVPIALANLGENGISAATAGGGLNAVFAESENSFIVGGRFTDTFIGPSPCSDPFPQNTVQHAARLNGDFLPPCPLSANCNFFLGGLFDPAVLAIERTDNITFLAGRFTQLGCNGSQFATNIAFANNGDSVWNALDDSAHTGEGVSGSPDGFPGTFEVKVNMLRRREGVPGILFAGGQFVRADGLVANSIAEWSAGANRWSVFEGPNGTGVTLTQFGFDIPGRVNDALFDKQYGRLHVAGHFERAGGISTELSGPAQGVAFFQSATFGGDPKRWFPMGHNLLLLDLVIVDGLTTVGENLFEFSASAAQRVEFLESGGTETATVLLRNRSPDQTLSFPFDVFHDSDSGWVMRAFLDGNDITDVLFDLEVGNVMTGPIPPGGSKTLDIEMTPGPDAIGRARLEIVGFRGPVSDVGQFELHSDAIEIQALRDCDANGVADADQIVANNALDTDNNTILDSCGINLGLVMDVDQNDIPDPVDEARANQPEFIIEQTIPIPSPNIPLFMIGGDRNNDGNEDITLVERNAVGEDRVTTAVTDAFGQFGPVEEECPFSVLTSIDAVKIADIDCDGVQETAKVVTFDDGVSDEVSLFLRIDLSSGGNESASAGSGIFDVKDMNNDGKPDLVVDLGVRGGKRIFAIHQNRGVDPIQGFLGFDAPTQLHVDELPGEPVQAVEIGDSASPGALPDVYFSTPGGMIAYQQDGPFNLIPRGRPANTDESPNFDSSIPGGGEEEPAAKRIRGLADLGGGLSQDSFALSPDGRSITVRIISSFFDGVSTQFQVREFVIQLPIADATGFTCVQVGAADVAPTPGGETSPDDRRNDLVYSALDAGGNPIAILITNLGGLIGSADAHLGFSVGAVFNPTPTSPGDGAQPPTPPAPRGSSNATAKILFADVNGDGKADLIRYDPVQHALLVGHNSTGGSNNCDATDIARFVSDLLAGAGCPESDANQDGSIDGRDVSPFVEALLGM